MWCPQRRGRQEPTPNHQPPPPHAQLCVFSHQLANNGHKGHSTWVVDTIVLNLRSGPGSGIMDRAVVSEGSEDWEGFTVGFPTENLGYLGMLSACVCACVYWTLQMAYHSVCVCVCLCVCACVCVCIGPCRWPTTLCVCVCVRQQLRSFVSPSLRPEVARVHTCHCSCWFQSRLYHCIH